MCALSMPERVEQPGGVGGHVRSVYDAEAESPASAAAGSRPRRVVDLRRESDVAVVEADHEVTARRRASVQNPSGQPSN